jgi:hypothetical protein
MTHYLKSFSICFLLGLLPWWSQAAEGRYALIIGIGQYSPDSGASVLPGIPKDMENVRKIARAMEIEERNIVELRDAQATRKNIVQALEKLRQQVQNGDQVLIYFSGHGTRLSAAGRCSEGLITYTPGAYTVADLLSEEDLARYTQPISQKADKLITLFDSCFSGGVLAARTRSLAQDLGIRPRFSPAASECSVPVNDRNTRSFAPVMTRLGAAQENFVQIAAANYNEVSWDFPTIGGLATHSLTQCLLGDASDLNRSGAVSLDEVRQCAQAKVDAAMKPFASTGRAPSTIQVRGARNLIVVPTQPQAALAPPPPPAPPRPAKHCPQTDTDARSGTDHCARGAGSSTGADGASSYARAGDTNTRTRAACTDPRTHGAALCTTVCTTHGTAPCTRAGGAGHRGGGTACRGGGTACYPQPGRPHGHTPGPCSSSCTRGRPRAQHRRSRRIPRRVNDAADHIAHPATDAARCRRCSPCCGGHWGRSSRSRCPFGGNTRAADRPSDRATHAQRFARARKTSRAAAGLGRNAARYLCHAQRTAQA